VRLNLLRLTFLLGALMAPFLAAPWSLLVLVVAAIAWLWSQPSRQEAFVALLFLGVAAAALGIRWGAEIGTRAPSADQVQEARKQYGRLWDDLQREAAQAALLLKKPPQDRASRLEAFRQLAGIEPASGRGRRSLLLIDPDGSAVAWSGEGLLHEFEADQVPRSGLHYQASFRAVTLLAVEPLEGSRRPWRVVAGASFPADVLPFPADIAARRWSLVDRPEQARKGALLVPLEGAPTLVLERLAADASPVWPWVPRLAWGSIAFAFLALAVIRGVALVIPLDAPLPSQRPERRSWILALFLAGVFAAGMAAALAPVHLALLVAGLGLAVWGLFGRRPGPPPRLWMVAARGAGATLLLAAGAWAAQLDRKPLDLADGLLPSAETVALRMAFAAAALGLFALCGRRAGDEPPPGDVWTWGAWAAVLAGAIFCDVPAVALPLLAVGGAAVALYANGQRLERGMSLAALVVLAAVTASACWETAYRARLHTHAREELLPRLAPPSPTEVSVLSEEIHQWLAGHDLGDVVPRAPSGLERQDLAYTLWRGSPLARPHALSAIVVEPREGAASTFSFGMPLTEQGQVDMSPVRWEGLRVPQWERSIIRGTAELRSGGRTWGTARYWLVPRPGFDPRDERRLVEVEAGLLRGGPVASPMEDLAGEALYALYEPDGRAVLTPWGEEPSLSPALRRPHQEEVSVATVRTPSGSARAYTRSSGQGWQVVYLPIPTPLEAVERAALPALGVLLILLLAAPSVLLLGLPRAAFRDVLWRALRSYSKRLVIVYTLLLLLPLVLLNAVLVSAMEERLQRQQREAGEQALDSAQQILAERLLNLQPGFGVDTVLGDRLLIDMAEIVHREVNLYYGSSIYASSKHELFTAGLLPNRIPGEIYSRLNLLGDGLSSRTNRAGGTTYLEVYAPLRLPGVPMGEERLFLSMPLLAQQEEAAAVLANLRRHAMLATAALFGLLVAVGTRLARNFTRPLMELVDGTRRIAAGATSLDLSPNELELAALVEAVDEMARRIAEGREKLLREKQVIERMVENITSGIVSLDAEGRVLLRNRVAAEMMGAEVGESLERVTAGHERLAPVAAFLRTVRGEMARETVHLPGTDGEREWSLIWVPLPGAGEPAALLVLEDATEVLRSQRLLAWAEMARIIAHEIKNPLTPIRLSTEHMREVWSRDPDHFDRVFERCTTNILTQVEELRTIASDFSNYSAILEIDPKPGDLSAAVRGLVEGYLAAPPEGVRLDLEMDGALPTRFDPKLLQRALRNILDNALRAAGTGGGHVLVRVGRDNGFARIAVLDDGPGVRPENLARIFDPYFSTHDTGTGLGLPIARRVVEEHGGNITARNRAEGGLEVAITLPM
jgi:signal transduction histidine kinase